MQNDSSFRAILPIFVALYVNIRNLHIDFILSGKPFVLGSWGAELTLHNDNSLTLRMVLRF